MSPRMSGALGALCAVVLVGPVAAQVGSPAGPVPPAVLAARRSALLERLGTGVAVLRSARLKSIEGDYPQDSDYREDNDFFYFTGLESPDSWLVLVARADAPDQVLLYLPARDSSAERWTGPRLGPGDEATALTGIAETRPADQVERDLRMLRSRTSPAHGGRLFLKLGQAAADDPFVRQLVLRDGVGVRDLRPEVAALRLIKDADELARLRRAIEITGEAERQAMRSARPGVMEYQLEATIEYTFRRLGAERVGFPSIVGSGPNSTVLHYDKNRRQTEPGDLVVSDVGAEYGYYSADVTRTFPVSGRFSPRQRAIYDLVLATQQAAIDAVRPGVTVGELNRIARSYMREHSGDLCGRATCDLYFRHGLSHWLGMDVHDVGDYSTPLAPGMVLTIEPGIYLPDEQIGIRIEDDLLVTADGHELLSAGAPRRAEEIERLMRH